MFHGNVARLLGVDGHWGVPGRCGRDQWQPDRHRPDRRRLRRGLADGPAAATRHVHPQLPAPDIRANGLVTPLDGSGETYLVYVGGAATTHLVLDLSGYFE